MTTARPDIRRRPPPQALEWAAERVGAGSRVVEVRALPSSWLANHALVVVDRFGSRHRLVLRRWARPGWEISDLDFTARREATVLELLAHSDVPAPVLVAADPDAVVCDVPALLLARLPGHPPRPPLEMASFLNQLAAALPAVHRVDGRAARVVPAYRRYYDPARLAPPAWSRRKPLWDRALQVASGPVPASAQCFIHRDYHPGNTLWSRGGMTGIVDWTSASFGPPSIDTAHMRWNLAVAYGVAAADEFLAAHQAVADPAFEHNPYWDVVAVVDVLPEIDKPGGAGPHVRDTDAYEEYLSSVLART